MIVSVVNIGSLSRPVRINDMMRLFMLFAASLALSMPAGANDQEVKQIKAELARAIPELKSASIKPSPVSGMYEVEYDSKIFYTTSDGKFLFMGDLMEVGTRNNLTETRRAALRARLLNDVGEENMLVIGPAKPRRTITVFTDVDCGYCAKFHLDVPALNKEGVKVRYLFFPRTGLNSDSYRRAVAVWCASDRAKAIGIAKAGGKIDMKTCANPVESHYHLGQRMEISGTPSIYIDDGRVLPGYIPAARLLGILGLKS